MTINTLALIVLFSLVYGQDEYIYVSTPMTYGAAQAYCVSQYNSNLATVQRDDRDEANNEIVLSGRETWIGLISMGMNGNFMWRNGDQCEFPSPGTCVDFWGTPEDGYGINVPLCVADGSGNKCVYYLEDTELVYNDLDCEEERPFLCQEDNTMTPPDPDVTFVGSCNTGGCTVSISDTCSDNGKITLTCDEGALSFDETTDAIQTCIDIPTSLIPAGISVTDVIVETAFLHTFVGDLQIYLQKGSDTVELYGANLPLGANGCCGCPSDNVNVQFSDDAVRPASNGRFCVETEANGFGLGGEIQSIDLLSTFDGDTAAGRWALYVYDRVGIDFGTFGTWSLELTLSQCPNVGSRANNDFMSLIQDYKKNGNNKYEFIEFVGLNVIISILTSVLVIFMVYCICCRSHPNNNKSKGYGMIEPELNVDESEDELPIKENL